MPTKKEIAWTKGFEKGYKVAVDSFVSTTELILKTFKNALKPLDCIMTCKECRETNKHYNGLVIKGNWYCHKCIREVVD